ncbi:MAG: ketopantoate reductase family protein [Rhodospirillales bacterium]|nr:ketopantoate reductase family protein [Rhodospirillales bacterium]MDE2199936.1 ketopantoate reductase family protein [Rhodospirillales bacterium]MDE2575190.1 ketopantoate reductase family protein [Rhodospirillales bacterium]
MKICFMGAGALGSTIGGGLASGGADVCLIDPFQAHVDAINADGLRMLEAGAERRVKITACTRAADAGVVADLVIILVKSYHTRDAIRAAAPIVGPGTVVMSLQNGLGHEDILAEEVGRERVMAGKTYVGGVLLAPGHVRSGVTGKETIIGELDGTRSARARMIADTFNAAGILTHLSDNIMGTMWDKLFINVAGGGLTAITGLTYGGLYAVPALEDIALAAIAEGIAVARAAEVRISITDPRVAWTMAAAGLPPEFKTSMLQSLQAGGATEVDYIHGSVVRWGARLGVPTPVNSTIVACVKGIEFARTDYPGKA